VQIPGSINRQAIASRHEGIAQVSAPTPALTHKQLHLFIFGLGAKTLVGSAAPYKYYHIIDNK